VTSVVVDPPRPLAAAVATVARARMMRLSVRIALLVTGSLLIAVGVAATLWIGLGPGPLDVFIVAVRTHSGLPLGVTVWAVVGAIIAASWLLGRRPGPGTLLSPLIVGPVMQIALSTLEQYDVPSSLAVRIVLHLMAVAVIGLGAGALIVSRLGAGSVELLAAAASRRSGRAEHRTRMAIELTCLTMGIALGGPVGVGTVLMALTIGPAVVIGHRLVDGAVTQTSQRVATTVTPSAAATVPAGT
jgi:uncharacterized membrane protein YczE